MADDTIIIIDDQTVDNQQFDLPFQIDSLPHAATLEPPERGKEVFKTGVSIILISVSGISNPPIVVTLNRNHMFLAMLFSFVISTTLVIGILLLVFSMVHHRVPRFGLLGEKLVPVGRALVKVTLGFGSSLALMAASSSWLVLFLVFIGTLYM